MLGGCNEVSKCVSVSSNVRFLEGQQGVSHDVCVLSRLCVRPKDVSQRGPVREQIGEPVCDFAPGRDRAQSRPVSLCVHN